MKGGGRRRRANGRQMATASPGGQWTRERCLGVVLLPLLRRMRARARDQDAHDAATDATCARDDRAPAAATARLACGPRRGHVVSSC